MMIYDEKLLYGNSNSFEIKLMPVKSQRMELAIQSQL